MYAKHRLRNLKIIKESKNQNKSKKTCNRRIKISCLVEGKCLSKNVIYKASYCHI